MVTKPVKSRGYTSEQVDRALLELAVCGGNSARAHRQLKAQGLVIPRADPA